jgi:uncharacterized protein (TIRG00374 family)
MDKKLTISLILGIIVSIVALYFAFRNVPFPELLAYLKSINYVYVIPAAFLSLISFAIRAVRWQIILSTSQKISFTQSFHPMMIGFMANCVLPGRIGEVTRPAILRKQEGIPFTTGLATVAAERFFDLVVLLALFAIVLSTVHIDPELVITFKKYQLNKATLAAIGTGMIKICILLIIGILAVSIGSTRRIIYAAIEAIPSLFFFSGKGFQHHIRTYFCAPVIKMVENVATGFELIKNPQKTLHCIFLSALIWTLQAFSYYVVAMGSPEIEVNFIEMYAVMIIIIFFIALPSAPGFWGLWEAGGVFALTLFGVSARAAAGYTLANHAVQVFPVIIVGFMSAFIIGVNFWRVPRS